ISGADNGPSASAGAIGLDRGPKPAARHPLGEHQPRPRSQTRDRIGCPCTRFIVSASGTTTSAPLLDATRPVPIGFALVIDPVGAGFVASLARPGGNITGFLMFEYGMSGKWLELLKQIAPNVTRAAVLRDPTIASGIGQFGAVQSVAPSFGLDASPV